MPVFSTMGYLAFFWHFWSQSIHLSFGFPIGWQPCVFPSKVFFGALDISILQMCPPHSSLLSLICVSTSVSLCNPEILLLLQALHCTYFCVGLYILFSNFFPFKDSRGHYPSFACIAQWFLLQLCVLFFLVFLWTWLKTISSNKIGFCDKGPTAAVGQRRFLWNTVTMKIPKHKNLALLAAIICLSIATYFVFGQGWYKIFEFFYCFKILQ